VVPPPSPAGKAPAPPRPDHGEEAAGQTVRGRLVADFIDADAAAGSTPGSGSESSSAAPVGGSGPLPLTAILAALLLAAGAAFEWLRQARGRVR
jgi:hypothetical protein